ncbi:hypothetical protein KR222_007800 [Zaprionus bogoriensis]|nr:hypothetical protein KR222_007800 [Zaprionus bogoriensis]
MAQSSAYIRFAVLTLLLQLCTAAPPVAQLDKSPEQQRGARLLDRFNHRYPDGSYEFRFELDDGTARYERGYFGYIDQVKTLMVVGYYSYRMPDGRYVTVFYNADQFGYRQNQSITPEIYPNLPRSIEVPLLKETTTPKQTQQQSQKNRQPSSAGFSSTSSSFSSSSTPRATTLPTRRGRY